MNSNDLTEAQLNALERRFRPKLVYLSKLMRRMEEQGFPADDELYRMTADARNAIYELRVKVHYLGCKGSTGGKR